MPAAFFAAQETARPPPPFLPRVSIGSSVLFTKIINIWLMTEVNPHL
jgi:hypothetical protein